MNEIPANELKTTNSLEIYCLLRKNGFVRVKQLLSPADVAILQQEAVYLLRQPNRTWEHFQLFSSRECWQSMLFAEKGRTTNYFDFIGLSGNLDAILDRLLCKPVVQELLMRVLGEEYRIWYCQIRRAEVDSRPLRIHQDKPGEFGMSILLSEIPSNRGTTVFIRGSHRWPRIINSFPFISSSSISFCTAAAKGSPGDAHFFYNDTWHGATNAEDAPAIAIILTFLPKFRQSNTRLVPAAILDSAEPMLRSALTGTVTNEGLLSKVDLGPDEVIQGGLPPRSVMNPWSILVAISALADWLLRQYRRRLR